MLNLGNTVDRHMLFECLWFFKARVYAFEHYLALLCVGHLKRRKHAHFST